MLSILNRPFVLLMLATFALMVIGIMSPEALAGGDKNRTQNPVIDQSGDIVGIVTPNVTCMSLVDQSGQTVWFCTQDEPADEDAD